MFCILFRNLAYYEELTAVVYGIFCKDPNNRVTGREHISFGNMRGDNRISTSKAISSTLRFWNFSSIVRINPKLTTSEIFDNTNHPEYGNYLMNLANASAEVLFTDYIDAEAIEYFITKEEAEHAKLPIDNNDRANTGYILDEFILDFEKRCNNRTSVKSVDSIKYPTFKNFCNIVDNAINPYLEKEDFETAKQLFISYHKYKQLIDKIIERRLYEIDNGIGKVNRKKGDK